MSASAIPHVITFLTKPLVTVAPTPAIATAQLILNASLTTPAATLALSSTTTPPPALLAACIGSSIPWATWLQALTGGRDVLLFFGPGYVKARIGDAPVADLWSEETQGSVVPISHAQLRATLLSARLRSVRRTPEAPRAIRIPTLPADADDHSSSDSESDADSEHSASSSSYSTDSATTAADSGCSVPVSPAALKSSAVLSAAPPLLYRAPQRRTATAVIDRTKKHLFASSASSMQRPRPYRAPALRPRSAPTTKTALAPAATATTTYLYQGGVTRVMTGGVMLGARASKCS